MCGGRPTLTFGFAFRDRQGSIQAQRRGCAPSIREMSSHTTDALSEKSPATHTPKPLAEKAGEVAVLEGRGARVALLAAAAVLLLLRLGALGVSAPDEPVYTEMAEEVRAFEHGPTGLVLLYLNGKPTDQKPPLYFWAAALFGAPGGRVTETAARLPSALAGIACVWLVLQIGTLLCSRRTALLGAALLVTTPFVAQLARRVALDVVLAMLRRAHRARTSRARRRARHAAPDARRTASSQGAPHRGARYGASRVVCRSEERATRTRCPRARRAVAPQSR